MTAQYLLLAAFRQPATLVDLSLEDWDLLLRQARQANLQARLCWLVDVHDLMEQVPPRARQHLEWSRVVTERHTLAVQWEVLQIQHALVNVGVPVILLKGAAYLMAKLPAAEGRLFSDIDIIVPKSSLNTVEAALMLHGWASTHHDEYDQRYYRTWMHELPPMQHIRRMTTIDVHHAILPETANIHPDTAKLLAAAQQLEGYNDLKVLAPVDMILHSAVHLFHEGDLNNGLRDLLDLDGLLKTFGTTSGFWPTLVDRAKEIELTRPLFYALRYTTRLLHTPVPSMPLQSIKAFGPGALTLWIMDQLYSRALMPVHPSCSDWFTGLARVLLFVRGNWLRMPPLLLARHLFQKAFISTRKE